jgi:hypothetical protein
MPRKENMTHIKEPPKDVVKYRLIPPNDIREDFVKSALKLLQGNEAKIATASIPIGWAAEIIEQANANGYVIKMQQVPVNMGELGTAHAVYYFERVNSK